MFTYIKEVKTKTYRIKKRDHIDHVTYFYKRNNTQFYPFSLYDILKPIDRWLQ